MATSMVKKVTNTSSSGYCKMPDGTLIQWGNSTIPSGGESVTVSFPLAFYDGAAYAFSALPAFATSRTMALVFSARASASIKVHANVNPLTSPQLFMWVAAGRWK